MPSSHITIRTTKIVHSMFILPRNIRLQADPGWKLEIYFLHLHPLYLEVVRVSVPYCSIAWSQLLTKHRWKYAAEAVAG
jgi:hypothetical protein